MYAYQAPDRQFQLTVASVDTRGWDAVSTVTMTLAYVYTTRRCAVTDQTTKALLLAIALDPSRRATPEASPEVTRFLA